jgi:hypothetical protein
MAGVALPTGLDRAPLVDGMQSQAQPNQVTFQPEVGPPMAWTDPIRGGSADWKFDPQNPYSFVARQNAVDVYVMTWRISKLP